MATITITLSKSDVLSGNDKKVAAVTLRGPQSTINFSLEDEAAALYRFRAASPMTLTAPNGDMLGHVNVTGAQTRTLAVTIKQGAPVWQSGKATLYFESVPGTTGPTPPPFDPEVSNGGVPN